MNDRGAPKKRGRPKKKPEYDRDKQIEDLVETAVSLMKIPFDDRDERPDDAPTLEAVAEEMQITPNKVKKLLISGDFYSTKMSRSVQALHKSGKSITEIMEETGLGQTSVYTYMPYEKGAYLLKEPTLYAEQTRLYRKRKKVCDDFADHLDCDSCCTYLWETIEAFKNYPFCYGDGERFTYGIESLEAYDRSTGPAGSAGTSCSAESLGSSSTGTSEVAEDSEDTEKPEDTDKDCGGRIGDSNAAEDWLCFNGMKISKTKIVDSYQKIRKKIRADGSICQTDALRFCGSMELLEVFIRIGACEIS